jgi:hypothetical protein
MVLGHHHAKEPMMNKSFRPSRQRQLEFCFEGDELWQRLPQSASRECLALLAQLLSAVIRQENEVQEVNEHE